MAQQFNYPKSETELRALQDELYKTAKEAMSRDERPSFTGLVEVMTAKATIVTAIHNIKANKGANTPGVDGVKIRNYLQSREGHLPLRTHYGLTRRILSWPSDHLTRSASST